MKRKKAGAEAPAVTDHALLRFLARSGVDVEGVRMAISSSLTKAHQAATSLGGINHLIVVDGLSFVVRNGNVTTVLDAGGHGDRFRQLRPITPEEVSEAR